MAAGKLPSFIATLGMMGMAAGAALVLTKQGAIYSDLDAFIFLGAVSITIVAMPTVFATFVYPLASGLAVGAGLGLLNGLTVAVVRH